MSIYFYAICVFLSAFLLFQIQPMVGKFLLPWYGGTPTVWSTILLFSQVVLTGGYAYAYWLLQRSRQKAQGRFHLILLGVSLALLLLTSLTWPSPLTPDVSWRTPPGSELPILGILRILIVAIGVPFLVLSANSTLMQAWFHRDHPQRTPYRLYALSNIGSLLALLSYPVLIEPVFTLHTQAYMWTGAYVAFAALTGAIALHTLRTGKAESDLPENQHRSASERPAVSQYILWLALAAVATILLIAMTNQLTQEIAVIPFLWVVPLAIYLLTFILAFGGGLLYSRTVYLVAFFVLAIGSRMLLHLPTRNLFLEILYFSLLLFVACMLCHNELYKLRPHADYLSSFYLLVAAGGAIGGILVTLVAPYIFSSGFWELQWGLIAVGALMIVVIMREQSAKPQGKPRKGAAPKTNWRQLLTPAVLILGLLVVLQIAYVIYYMSQVSSEALLSRRNFYGIVRVWEINKQEPALLAYQMAHGQTAHGFQFEAEQIRSVPTTYFTETSGVGLTLLNHRKRPGPLRVGGLGLGIGVIASYGQEGDTFRFYEVDPIVIDIALGEGGYFSFLQDSPARMEVVEGDARVALEEELLSEGSQQYDVLVVDTFSGGTIPLHLLTKEAFEIYLQHLAEGGIMAINVSNNYFDLPPAVFNLAQEFGLTSMLIENRGDGLQSYDSVWVLLAREPGSLLLPEIMIRQSQPPVIPDNFRVWTDNFSNLWQVLK